jgi:hypothetical protein
MENTYLIFLGGTIFQNADGDWYMSDNVIYLRPEAEWDH